MEKRSGPHGTAGEAEELVAVEAGRFVRAIEDFQDPRQEWRRLVSELLGTFFLVLVAAGGGMMGAGVPGHDQSHGRGGALPA